MNDIFEYVVGDKLNREVYSFWLSKSGLVLSSYSKEERPTPKHRWKVISDWSRVFSRKWGDRPVVPPEVSEAAVEHFRSQIVFKSE